MKRVPNDAWKEAGLEFVVDTNSGESARIRVDRDLILRVPLEVKATEVARVIGIIRKEFTRPERWEVVRKVRVPMYGDRRASAGMTSVDLMNDGKIVVPLAAAPEDAEWAVRILRKGGGQPA